MRQLRIFLNPYNYTVIISVIISVIVLVPSTPSATLHLVLYNINGHLYVGIRRVIRIYNVIFPNYSQTVSRPEY